MKLESNDKSYNMNKWNVLNDNILFITGLSGSGKSTISESIHEETNCEVVRLDDFRNDSNTSTVDFVSLFKKKHPITEKYFKDRWKDNTLFEKYFVIYLDFVIDSIKKDKNKLYAIEGIQIYCVPYRKEWFSNKPLIIKGTEIDECYARQIERGSTKINDRKRLKKDKIHLSTFEDKYLKSNGLFESSRIINGFMRSL